MAETTEEVIGVGYQTVNPEAKGLLPNSVRKGLINTREFFIMLAGGHKIKDLVSEEQKERAERKGKTVGNPEAAKMLKKKLEEGSPLNVGRK